jgi:hypothetical protein
MVVDDTKLQGQARKTLSSLAEPFEVVLCLSRIPDWDSMWLASNHMTGIAQQWLLRLNKE